MRTMTFPLPYEIIAPGGYVMDTHIKFAVDSGQLSSMNALQVECQKRHGAELMASPTNNSFTGRGFSGRKLTNRWNLKVLLLLLLYLFSMIKKNKLLIQHLLRYVLMRCQRRNLPFSDQMLLSVLEIW